MRREPGSNNLNSVISLGVVLVTLAPSGLIDARDHELCVSACLKGLSYDYHFRGYVGPTMVLVYTRFHYSNSNVKEAM